VIEGSPHTRSATPSRQSERQDFSLAQHAAAVVQTHPNEIYIVKGRGQALEHLKAATAKGRSGRHIQANKGK
jgi:ATP-dependent protease HslVU (ClpYQ) peptidase subunit